VVAERKYLGFFAEVFLSASIFGVQEAGYAVLFANMKRTTFVFVSMVGYILLDSEPRSPRGYTSQLTP
jgi:hypothetical protein